MFDIIFRMEAVDRERPLPGLRRPSVPVVEVWQGESPERPGERVYDYRELDAAGKHIVMTMLPGPW